MRRILLVLTVAAVMASMMVFSVVPAFAQVEEPDDKIETPTGEVKDDKTEVSRTVGSSTFPITVKSESKDDKSEITLSNPLATLTSESKDDKSERTVTNQFGTSTSECKEGEPCETTTQPPPS